jgi:hypothetical protein
VFLCGIGYFGEIVMEMGLEMGSLGHYMMYDYCLSVFCIFWRLVD